MRTAAEQSRIFGANSQFGRVAQPARIPDLSVYVYHQTLMHVGQRSHSSPTGGLNISDTHILAVFANRRGGENILRRVLSDVLLSVYSGREALTKQGACYSRLYHHHVCTVKSA